MTAAEGLQLPNQDFLHSHIRARFTSVCLSAKSNYQIIGLHNTTVAQTDAKRMEVFAVAVFNQD